MEKSLTAIKVDKKLYLKIRTPNEAQIYFDLLESNREYLKPWMPFLFEIKSVEETEKHIEKHTSLFCDGNKCDYGIYYNKILIGSGGLINIYHDVRSGEIGGWVSQAWSNQGIMTKVVSKIMAVAKKHYRLDRVFVRVEPNNLAGKAIPKKLGFLFESISTDPQPYGTMPRNLELWSFELKK